MKIYYGWWLVAGLVLVLTMSSGLGFYNLSVYLNALSEERGIPVAHLSGAISLVFFVGGITGLLVARFIARYDVRWVMVVGALIGGLALAGLSVTTETWQVWALFAMFGVGNTGVSLIPATTVVTRWFPGANRSIALSIASTGLSMGGVLVTPLCAGVIHRLGFDEAMPWLGLMFVCVTVPVALLLVRSWPEGQAPVESAATHAGNNEAYHRAKRGRFFILSNFAYVFVMGAQVGAIAHLFNHVDKIAGHLAGSAAVSILALCSIFGRLLGGVLVTRLPIRPFTLINMLGQCLGLALAANATDEAGALLAAGIFGVTVGNLLMLQPLLIAEAYGVANYPRLYSLANLITMVGVASGPLAMGMLHDSFNYASAFVFAGGCSLVAAVLFFSGGPLPVPAPNIHASVSEPAR